jgi:hypothetical protein
MPESVIVVCTLICTADAMIHCRDSFGKICRACWHCVCWVWNAYVDAQIIPVNGGVIIAMTGQFIPDSEEQS